MTVSSTTSRADANGNGVTTAFTGSFRILDQTHITVLRTQISTGVVTTLALTTDYTVAGVGGASFTVTCVATPTADQRISILRNVPFTQLTDYVENDPFPAASHEDALDKLTMAVQQLDEAQDRAITLAPNSTGISVELPEAEASALIGWNAAADALVNYTSATTAPVTAFAETLLDDTTAAEARTTLGLVISTNVAEAGANDDITSLSGLTTAITVAQGGQGLFAIPAPTFNAGAMTIPSASFTLDFRNATLTTGTSTRLTATDDALVIPSGATLGLTSAVQSDLIRVEIYPAANTIEQAIVNLAGGNDLSESGVISTTAISTGADSANVFYSNTARTNVPYRVVGLYRSTQATAGTWATAPSLVQGMGGEAQAGKKLYPSGSAPVYGIRAWAAFDGTLTGTNAPAAGGNVASITRNSAGDYTITFSIQMQDADYAFAISGGTTAGVLLYKQKDGQNKNVSFFPLTSYSSAGVLTDVASISIFFIR